MYALYHSVIGAGEGGLDFPILEEYQTLMIGYLKRVQEKDLLTQKLRLMRG